VDHPGEHGDREATGWIRNVGTTKKNA
jgi:hypothetical protein